MKLAIRVLVAAAVLALAAGPALAGNPRISQVYGAGGNAGATYNADFVELYNDSPSAVSLAGWAIQYASATGSSWTSAPLSGSIAAGGYYLIRMSATGVNGVALPTPDLIAAPAIAMGATAGKLALTNTTPALPAVTCPTGGSIVDFAGYGATANCFEGAGPTPAPSTTNSAARKSQFTQKNIDTDQNSTDFVATGVCPRNSATTTDPCGPTAAGSSTWGKIKTLYR